MISTNALRKHFIEYFQKNAHRFVPSGSLVPASDPTLLFTNAGMVQFKDVFLGREKRDYSRAVTSQRCVRAGGKHNDLENVGYTARHHTFFEMLGNFSFGDYFKKDAIAFAWNFLTKELGLPEEKLWVTVYEQDEQAADIWLKELGVSEQRFSRIGAKDNFWSMGDTGPCGPCTEIFYDHGPDIAGGPPGTPEEDGDRYVEIWNLVFMQYDRQPDGQLKPLPKPSVDTGMGLERIAAVMQGTSDNYGIDLFQALIEAAQKAVGLEKPTPEQYNSLKVIADHIRATSFLITDGVMPSNEGRGYVLRRIMRRAIRHGHKVGATDLFFNQLVAPLVEQMGEAFPELANAQAQIERVITQEERRFAETLSHGMHILEQTIAKLDGKQIPGDTVFVLYDTYGFPVDLTNDVARERGLTLDTAGFETAMQAQRERARAASRFDGDYHTHVDVEQKTNFVGYDNHIAEAKVIAVLDKGQSIGALQQGQHGAIVLDTTPFYAESGGQVGDTGIIELADGMGVFKVTDTQKQSGVFVHVGEVLQGSFQKGVAVRAAIDNERRQTVTLNHSGTHLLHAALRQVLGSHVQQKGSLVAPDRLRFDFAHFEPLTQQQWDSIETLVNDKIRANITGQTYERSYDDAIAEGALAFFDEKYGDTVRVVRFGDYSVELCGGTHVKASGEIGLLKLTEQRGVASGVRRIEALTGADALAYIQASARQQDELAGQLKTAPSELVNKLQKTLVHTRDLEKQIQELGQKLAATQGSDLAGEAKQINGLNVIAAHLQTADRKTLRETLDALKSRVDNAVVVLGTAHEGKVALVAGVNPSCSKSLPAGKLVNFVAEQVGGKGGGRPDMAQAGGSQPENLDAALESVYDWVKQQTS